MNEKRLLKITLICSLIGLFILFIFSENISISEKDISKIEDEGIGDDVKIIGKVSKVTNTDKIAFLEIYQEKIEKITVVLFKNQNISLMPGMKVEVVGSIEDYNGENEIIGNRVEII